MGTEYPPHSQSLELGSREKRNFLAGKKGGRRRRRRGREERRKERREREKKRRERRFNHKLKSHDKYGYRYNLEEQCVKVC